MPVIVHTTKGSVGFARYPAAVVATLAIGCLLGSPHCGFIAAGDARSTGRLKGIDLDGRLCRLGERGNTKAVVVTFMSTQCPISNSYVPQLNELSSKYRRSGVEFYGVVSDPSVTRADAISHRATYKVRFPVLFDGSGELRLALGPTHTPQVFVLDHRGRVLYSGAIDDRYVQLGRKKEAAETSWLEDAVQSVVHGTPIAVASTKPIGCQMEEPPNKTREGSVTYTRDIAPIIQAHCSSCHRENQSAPFPLLTYDDVSSHANQIAEVTRDRYMPPWKPAPGFTRLRDEMRLSDHQIDLIDVWVESGKPEGDPADLPAPVQHVKGWKLGEPDLILEMQEAFTVPASGPDIRQYFVIPSRLTDDRLITAIDFHPGTPQAIHHASFYLDTRRAGRRLDEADPAPGYSGFGGPQFESQGTLTSWFPGMTPRKLPRGMGRLVAKGSDIVAEIHYVTTGKTERDRSKIGLYFAHRSARQLVVEVQVGNKDIEIPPDQSHHHERAAYTLPVKTMLLDLVPHMHMLGSEVKVWAKSPDGRTKPLLWIKDWDFNWQGQYSFAKPVILPQGTQIIVDAWFDNSSNNPLNPHSPPVTVRWGDNSTDEMLLCTFQCTCETMDELGELIDHQRRYISEAQER
ncbi:redoxin family protein [Stieleria sp. ICT_E10.1]|uniref:redoxin family protein n=1 Tax=Stieleria sedimenti TaxID=2976331 RepID=UPI00218077BA|nr:redoxin family protein [Stieleria sedimenti]MCS7466216.1 redoxin family protein [Stieleria sedimenti]